MEPGDCLQMWLNTFFPDHNLERLRNEKPICLEDAMSRWPTEFPLARREGKELLGAACGRLMLASIRAGDRIRAGAWLVRACRHDLRWLRRGALWSTLAETCLGRALAERMRGYARWVLARRATAEEPG